MSYQQIILIISTGDKMDYKTGKNIWDRVFDIYKNNVESSWYDFIFRSVNFEGISDNTLYLSCPNEFLKDSIEKKDLKPLQNILDDDLGMSQIKVKIIIDREEMKLNEENGQYEKKFVPKSYLEDYTFDNFVKGSSNHLAYSACIAVAENPEQDSQKPIYNPLFIYGDVGLGKTHLMHAIANYSAKRNEHLKIEYVSSETFTNELIESIRAGKNEEFRNKYRNLDMILIDDIQFLAGKEGTQEEFFHTFNTLYSAKKQIVISSDKPPREIATLEDRLKSRFEQGLIVDIQPPDFETRVAILKNKAQFLKKQYTAKQRSMMPKNMDIPEEGYTYIAKNIKSNIRELEGALNKIYAYADLMDIHIDFPMIKDCLKNSLGITENVPGAEFIMETVASEYGLTVSELKNKKRTNKLVIPRQIAMYLCRETTDLSLPAIGSKFSRDHTTVIHAVDKIAEDMKKDPDLTEKILKLKSKIENT